MDEVISFEPITIELFRQLADEVCLDCSLDHAQLECNKPPDHRLEERLCRELNHRLQFICKMREGSVSANHYGAH